MKGVIPKRRKRTTRKLAPKEPRPTEAHQESQDQGDQDRPIEHMRPFMHKRVFTHKNQEQQESTQAAYSVNQVCSSVQNVSCTGLS